MALNFPRTRQNHLCDLTCAVCSRCQAACRPGRGSRGSLSCPRAWGHLPPPPSPRTRALPLAPLKAPDGRMLWPPLRGCPLAVLPGGFCPRHPAGPLGLTSRFLLGTGHRCEAVRRGAGPREPTSRGVQPAPLPSSEQPQDGSSVHKQTFTDPCLASAHVQGSCLTPVVHSAAAGQRDFAECLEAGVLS